MDWIAIDLGSTSIKAALLDIKGKKVLNYCRFPITAKKIVTEYIYEIDADKYFQEVREILALYVSKVKESECGVRISTQMHGFILADEKGVPATPYISWQDCRCQRSDGKESDFQQLEKKLEGQMGQESGSCFKPGQALCNLYSMEKRGEISRSQKLRLHSLGSYMINRICNSYCTHITNACPMGMANVKKREWNEKIINIAGLDQLYFPRIVSAHEPIGEKKICGKRVVFYPDIGDQQTSVLGVMGEKEKEIYINIATAGQVSRITEKFQIGEFESRPFFESSYLNTFTGLPAGRNLQVLNGLIRDVGKVFYKKILSDEFIYNVVSEALKYNQEKCSLNENLDYFQGKGEITKIAGDNMTVAQLYMGAYESMIKIYKDKIEKLNVDYYAIDAIAIGGVLEKNEILFQMLQGVCQLHVQKKRIKDSVIVGHDRLALIDEGEYNSIFDQELLERKLQWV